MPWQKTVLHLVSALPQSHPRLPPFPLLPFPPSPPLQAYEHRTDNKLYRIQTPQTPVARTQRYEDYCMDEYPNGTNAIVAVLAYTGGFRSMVMRVCAVPLTLHWAVLLGMQAGGSSSIVGVRAALQSVVLSWAPRNCFELPVFCALMNPLLDPPSGYDMEDAMILNRSAVDRGFAHAYLYKTETIDLREERGRCGCGAVRTGRGRAGQVARPGQGRAGLSQCMSVEQGRVRTLVTTTSIVVLMRAGCSPYAADLPHFAQSSWAPPPLEDKWKKVTTPSCRDVKFSAEPLPPGRKRPPYSQREKPVGAFGAEYPQMVPSTPDSAAVKTKG